ncbi:MAG TPA: energy coupling factor transporter S component ThiW [Symbiobacteriaceae bacterium]|jgi:energy coupling factor transporter S component ThiW
MKSLQVLTRMAVLVALGVVASYMMAIPLFGARLFPAQAAINVVAGALLGPWYAALTALMIAALRITLGTGSLLAIPGSLFGALLAGFLYQATRSRLAAMAGEVVGTGVIAALVAYPMAVVLLNNAKAASAGIAFYIIPFGSSSLAGALLGGAVLAVLERWVAPVSARGLTR